MFLLVQSLDPTLKSLTEELGFKLNAIKLNHLAYADDTVLMKEIGGENRTGIKFQQVWKSE